MPVNLGTLAAGIGSGIKSLGDTYSNIPVRLARAQLMGSQQAIADQKMQNAIDTRAAMQYLADSTGIDPRLLGGAADAAEGLARLKLNNGIRLNRAAGQLDPVGEVIAATENLQAQNNPSFSENASVTPPISQLFRKAPVDPAQAPLPAPEPGSVEAARQESKGNIQRNAQLIDMLQTVGAIQNALNGGAMYQSTAQGGAFNRYTGEGSIADQGLRDLYEANLRNKMQDREKRTTIAEAREKNRPKGGGRKGGGRRGGGRGRSGTTWSKPFIAPDGSERQVSSNGSVKIITKPPKKGLESW